MNILKDAQNAQKRIKQAEALAEGAALAAALYYMPSYGAHLGTLRYAPAITLPLMMMNKWPDVLPTFGSAKYGAGPHFVLTGAALALLIGGTSGWQQGITYAGYVVAVNWLSSVVISKAIEEYTQSKL